MSSTCVHKWFRHFQDGPKYVDNGECSWETCNQQKWAKTPKTCIQLGGEIVESPSVSCQSMYRLVMVPFNRLSLKIWEKLLSADQRSTWVSVTQDFLNRVNQRIFENDRNWWWIMGRWPWLWNKGRSVIAVEDADLSETKKKKQKRVKMMWIYWWPFPPPYFNSKGGCWL